MCSVGDQIDIDISGKAEWCSYTCLDCSKEFKGIGKNLRCPTCHSTNVKAK